ncbi:MAG: hypothetical protein R6W77_15835 [Trueperaceae bacterium]
MTSPVRFRGSLRQRATMVGAALCLASFAFAQRPLPLSGIIVNPTGAEGTIAAWGGYIDAGAQSTVALGTVRPDGAFTLELPGTISPAALGEADVTSLCVGGGADMTVTPARFGHMLVNFLLAFETSEPVGAMMVSSDEALERLASEDRAPQEGDYLVYFLYVTETVRVEGACVGPSQEPVRYDVRARPGWNTLLMTYETVEGGVRAVMSSVDQVPDGAAWRSLVD